MTNQKIVRKAQPVWVTVNLTDCNPKGLIHLTRDGNRTLCNKSLSGRWYIGTTEEVTCKSCSKIVESI
jgi:hypothetical protein